MTIFQASRLPSDVHVTNCCVYYTATTTTASATDIRGARVVQRPELTSDAATVTDDGAYGHVPVGECRISFQSDAPSRPIRSPSMHTCRKRSKQIFAATVERLRSH